MLCGQFYLASIGRFLQYNYLVNFASYSCLIFDYIDLKSFDLNFFWKERGEGYKQHFHNVVFVHENYNLQKKKNVYIYKFLFKDQLN